MTACMNGIEALEYLRTCSRLPNLVLLDVMMPQMNGYECCQVVAPLSDLSILISSLDTTPTPAHKLPFVLAHARPQRFC